MGEVGLDWGSGLDRGLYGWYFGVRWDIVMWGGFGVGGV